MGRVGRRMREAASGVARSRPSSVGAGRIDRSRRELDFRHFSQGMRGRKWKISRGPC